MPKRQNKTKGARRRAKQLAKTTPNVSRLYDDALPVSLKSVGVSPQRGMQIKPRTGKETNLSPYIIHLSREEARADAKEVAAVTSLEALLMEEAPAEITGAKDDLKVAREEFAAQLREQDLQIAGRPRAKERVQPIEAPGVAAAPPIPFTPLERRELLALLAAQETDLAIEESEEPPVLEEILSEAPASTKKPTAYKLQPTSWIPSFRLPRLALPPLGKAHHRAIASFTILSFSLVMPISAMRGLQATSSSGSEIMQAGTQAAEDLMRGASALEEDRFDIASTDFERASAAFASAQDELEDYGAAVTLIARMIPKTDSAYSTVSGLLTAGEELANAAAEISAAADQLVSQSSISVVTKLRILSRYVESALPHMEAAQAAASRIDATLIPEEHQDAVNALTDKTPRLTQAMQELLTFSDALATILGEEQKMRYLVTFQNNTELRATGGFIGSFAEMDMYQGEIDNIFIPSGGAYDVQGQLSEFVEAPKPLSLINPRWEFHDANWFPDFPSSASKLLWFYEKAGGPTVDGVIAINATMMPKLLDILGPIEMEGYDRVINSENFLFETQKIVEFEYEQYQEATSEREEEAPKQFIADLAPILLERIEQADATEMLAIMEVLGTALFEKDAMLYFEDNALQAEMELLGWSGALKQTSGDSLMIVNSNLGGRKTDTVIEQTIDLEVDVAEDGAITNTLTITKTHHGLVSTLFEGENNVDYVRAYVPKGSELISASRSGGEFEIPEDELFEESDLALVPDEDLLLAMQNQEVDPVSGTDIWIENGRTVFGNWIQTKPGEIETITFVYKLPITLETPREDPSLLEIAKARLGFKSLAPYTLLLQKQPGVLDRTTYVTVNLPETSDVIWSSHNGSTAASDIMITNEQDAFVRMLIEHEIR